MALQGPLITVTAQFGKSVAMLEIEGKVAERERLNGKTENGHNANEESSSQENNAGPRNRQIRNVLIMLDEIYSPLATGN